MNNGLLEFPRGAHVAAPYRHLDAYGLATMPGDVTRFSAAHMRADAGDALPGVWRPVQCDHVGVPSVDQGCLVLKSDSVLGALWTKCAVEVDCILEFSPKVPGDDLALEFLAGVFLSVGAAGFGAAVRKSSGSTQDVLWGAVPRTLMISMLTGFTLDPTDPSLSIITSLVPTSGELLAPALPLLLRVKRQSVGMSSTVGVYVSTDGLDWMQVTSSTGVDLTTPTNIGILTAGSATGGITATARLTGVKFLNPATPFPS